jgi:DNA-binding transcriptional regulator YhcF (GntR family)
MITGRLERGMRLPATCDFVGQHGISRRVVVNVFEQLRPKDSMESARQLGHPSRGPLPLAS